MESFRKMKRCTLITLKGALSGSAARRRKHFRMSEMEREKMCFGLDIGSCFVLGCSLTHVQCDQKKSPNVYKSRPKNDFTRKKIDFDTVTKIA